MADTLYLAWYGSWPNAATVVGVFDTQERALKALEQSDGPPEGYTVSPLFLNHRYELEVSDGL